MIHVSFKTKITKINYIKYLTNYKDSPTFIKINSNRKLMPINCKMTKVHLFYLFYIFFLFVHNTYKKNMKITNKMFTKYSTYFEYLYLYYILLTSIFMIRIFDNFYMYDFAITFIYFFLLLVGVYYLHLLILLLYNYRFFYYCLF